MKLKEIFKKRFFTKRAGFKAPENSQISYSQEGEDLLLDRLMGGKQIGLFVDVGAHHPSRFSNTRYFYEKGWSGINIDPLPGVMNLFDEERPRDTNIEAGIAEESRLMTYYMFNEPALNTFCIEEANKKDGLRGEYWIVEKRNIEVRRLDVILKDNSLGERKIDFLSVDAEGFDLNVLRSNDWDLFRPTLVLAEALESSLVALNDDPVVSYMKTQGYSPIAKTLNTVFFRDIPVDEDASM